MRPYWSNLAKNSALALATLFHIPPGNAALLDRGGGMIYDTALGITWLADADYALTSGYDDDGNMLWEDALLWANSLSYGGFTDWRLPRGSFDCSASEMCSLFIALGGVPGSDIRQTHNANFDVFVNIQGGYYWSETTAPPPDETRAFNFNFEIGGESIDDKAAFFRNVWAVRDGDVGVVPLPAGVWLLCSALAGLAVTAARRQRMV